MNSKYTIRIAFGAWILVQAVIIICLGDIEQMRDAYGYMNNALFCYENNCIAPSIKECFSEYVQGPGYTNYLLLIYAIFNSFKPVLWLNLAMNSLVAYEIYWLGKHFYSRRTGMIAAVLFAAMVNNLFVPLHILTELPFLFLGLTGFLLVCKGGGKHYAYILAASIIFAIGYTVKPLIYAFLIPAIVLLYVRKCDWKSYAAMLVPYIIALQAYGYIVEQETGVKVTGSTTGGFNLCMSSISVYADYTVFEEGRFGHIENGKELNVLQKDSIRKAKAIEKIFENPTGYIKNCLKKPFLLFENDLWAWVGHTPIWRIYNEKLIKPINNEYIERYVNIAFTRFLDIPFYLVTILFLVSLFMGRKDILSEKGIILLIAILGIGATCIFHVECRYHHTYMITFCIWAAAMLENKLDIFKIKKDKIKK